MSAEKETIMVSNKALTSRNEGDMVELTEDNIPGARLTGAMDGYTMSELKWWFLCCGVKAPNSWNKKKANFKVIILFIAGV